jgi:hypothetical protein
MGPEVLVIFVLGVVSPMALLGLIVSWWLTAADRRQLEVLWERYARRRGFAFTPAVGEWPNRLAPVVSWTDGGTRYRLEASGAEAVVSTRVVARPAVAALGVFALSRTSASRSTEAGRAVTGDPLIDGHFVVEGHPTHLVRRCLTPDVTRALVGFDVGTGGSLRYSRGDLELSWAGGEENDARLDEAREVLRRAVRALERPYEEASRPA